VGVIIISCCFLLQKDLHLVISISARYYLERCSASLRLNHIFIQLAPPLLQYPVYLSQGWKTPTFWFSCKKLYFNKLNHLFILALGSRHHHWRTLGPLSYNLNLYAIQPNRPGFCWTSYDSVFEKNYEKPNHERPCAATPILPHLRGNSSSFGNQYRVT
jgi:hypothetical protein